MARIYDMVLLPESSRNAWLKILEWKVSEGGRITDDAVFVVYETDSGLSSELSYVDGIVLEILVPAGARVPRGAPALRIAVDPTWAGPPYFRPED